MDKYIEIGKIVNTYGIKGQLKIVPYTDNIKRFEKLKKIYINEKEYLIENVKYIKNIVILKLQGINTIEQAEEYRNLYMYIDRKDAIKLPKDTYFIRDLIGIEVYTNDGEKLGIIDDIFKTGSNDVYFVRNSLGKQIVLPAISSVIEKIDLENKKVTVNLIKGLI